MRRLVFNHTSTGTVTWEPPADICAYLDQLAYLDGLYKKGEGLEVLALNFFDQVFLSFCDSLVKATLGRSPTDAFNIIRAKLLEMNSALEGLQPGDKSKVH